MKWVLNKKLFLVPCFLFFLSYNPSAQTFENAGQYLDYINNANEALTVKWKKEEMKW
jgi:hypothetical protein